MYENLTYICQMSLKVKLWVKIFPPFQQQHQQADLYLVVETGMPELTYMFQTRKSLIPGGR